MVDEEATHERDAEGSRAALARMDVLTKALSGLIQEREMVKRLSTWPWDTGTLRAVAASVALPVILFLITRYLERFV
jgi:hypothetical protein